MAQSAKCVSRGQPLTEHESWRVRAENPCAAGAYSAVFDFLTANLLCFNLNLPIPEVGEVVTTFTVETSETIRGLNVYVNMVHPYLGDVQLRLTHGGKEVSFFDRPGYPDFPFGCGGNNLDNTFDDEGTTSMENGCRNITPAYPEGATLVPNPENLLARFDGQDVAGEWIVTVDDYVSLFAGRLNQICLELPSTNPTAVHEPHRCRSGCDHKYAASTVPVAALAVGSIMLLVGLGMGLRKR